MIVLFYLSALLSINFSFRAWSEGEIGFFLWQIAKVIVMVAYVFLITYIGVIDLSGSAWLSHMAWLLAILWILDGFMFTDDLDIIGVIRMAAGVLTIIVVLIFLFFQGTWIADTKYDTVTSYIDKKVAKQDDAKKKSRKALSEKKDVAETDEQNIVSVPLDYAKYKAEKLVGELKNSSYYDLGVYSIQRIDGRLKYVTPIEFDGYSTWNRSGRVVPGYIVVDALDENAEAKLVKKEMKYVPSSWFGDNLQRKVRKEYPTDILLETSFEPDDNGKPYYVVTYGHFEVYRNVKKVEGVILFDPSNGSMKKYKTKDVPKFVDQVVPGEEIATDYNEWYGKYNKGWLNSWWGKQGVIRPTDSGFDGGVSPVFDNKGNMEWFTDYTTLNENASSIVGYSMINARTGEFKFYSGKNVNGLINGKSAKGAVNKTFTKDKWEGTQPMLYNIYGQMTWFVPVVDKDGLLRNYALVNAKDPKVLATSDTKGKAFDMYKRLVVTKLGGKNVKPGEGIDFKTVKGTIIAKEVVTKGDDVITYVRLDNDKDKVYELHLNNNPYSVVLKEGQQIEVNYVDTEDVIVEIEKVKELN